MSTAIPLSNDPAPGVSPSYWHGVARRLRRDKVSMSCLLVLGLIILAAIFAPVLTPYDPAIGSALRRLRPVGTPGHILGTDELGRDMLTRLLYGARLSLVMGITPVALAFLIGGSLGMLAGFVGGRTNAVIMRSADVIFAFPSILLAIAVAGILGAGMTNAIVALTIVLTPPIVRVAETATTQVSNLDFVEAARASGAGSTTILRAHVLGNVLSPILVYTTSLFSVAAILASGLSFIGLGAKPPAAEWGLMLSNLRNAIYSQPLVAALPGAFIFAVSLSFNLLADGLRNAMDVR